MSDGHTFGTMKGSVGLGDTLLLTAICKNVRFTPTIHLRPTQQRFRILFDKIANVKIVKPRHVRLIIDRPARSSHEILNDHWTYSKLRNYFDEPDAFDIRPLVLHSTYESEKWARDYIQSNFSNDKPCVIYKRSCSAHWDYLRSIPVELSNNILSDLSKDFNVIDMASPEIANLDLSKYICLLRRCGSYVGCNTGDMHLAISVGCQCTIYEPSDWDESHRWRYRHPTIKYVNWS